jgi:hypothetical protein
MFASSQTLGYVLPQFANIHSNPAPFFIGVVLLLPGALATFVLPMDHVPTTIQRAFISGINTCAWYLIWRMAAKTNTSTSPE